MSADDLLALVGTLLEDHLKGSGDADWFVVTDPGYVFVFQKGDAEHLSVEVNIASVTVEG